ncbi:SAM domain-containing protein SAMSN-1b isoform X2 [Denticeps clupeoides]|uniref:Uncharacterized protein n=2 Tax=Denticeps clupeoides TaxID=299321 RepID=A0AAY4D4R5_9TELE|nr:SAM domain-containing protein SAMSN-1 isoform X2 [Denticeps clupeoides]
MCIGLAKRPERKYGKETPQDQQHTQPTVKEVDDDDVETLWSPGLFHHGWNTTESAFAWESHYHTCQRTAETRMHNFNFTLPRGTDWDKYECLIHELDIKEEHLPQRIIRSITDLDISDPMRSSSFGKFDSFRHHTAQVKSDENGGNVSTEVEAPDVDHNKPGSIGKKMKAISLTMRKRMGKKYAKALSEEMGEMTEGDREACADEVSGILTKDSMRSCNSLESLYSLNSGQSSSSGVTSGSEGSSNRDSLRLEEETQYTGQFCGKAKVHTDFVPSPYDTESLKLKVGDMIDIIRKPPMGIWTGMLNNKVGTFKFIYVDVVVEKESEPQHRIRTHRRSKRPRPKTLQELLERLNLEDLASSLMLNGYETVEDLKDLKEQHLIELNVTNPEQRHRLLAAAECLQEAEYYSQKSENEVVEEPTSPSKTLKVEINDCPRDSGCYITSDSKEEPENLLSVHPPPAEG